MSMENPLGHGESIIVSLGTMITLVCCDCGLVHDIVPSYDPAKGLVALMIMRNDEKTQPIRKRMKRKKKGIFSKKRRKR